MKFKGCGKMPIDLSDWLIMLDLRVRA